MVYIYGEVQRPGPMRLERSMMTLMQVLASGGLTQRGTERGIRVHRKAGDGKGAVLQPGMDESLKDGDVVYVRKVSSEFWGARTFVQFLSILRAVTAWHWPSSSGLLLTAIIATVLWPRSYTAVASVVVDQGKPDPLSAVMYNTGMNPAVIATQIDVIQVTASPSRWCANLKADREPAAARAMAVRHQWRGSMEQWLSDVFQRALDVKPSRQQSTSSTSRTRRPTRASRPPWPTIRQAYLGTNLELRVSPRLYSSFFDQRARLATPWRKRKPVSPSSRRTRASSPPTSGSTLRTPVSMSCLQVVSLQALASDSGSRQNAAKQGAERMQEVLANPLVSGLQSRSGPP